MPQGASGVQTAFIAVQQRKGGGSGQEFGVVGQLSVSAMAWFRQLTAAS
jgi:hypothetical protein